MSHYVKKPVVIEAFRIHPNDDRTRKLPPQWFVDALLKRDITPIEHGLRIDTPEGSMTANVGDWVIKGVKGELYPCRDDVFQATYEALPTKGAPQ